MSGPFHDALSTVVVIVTAMAVVAAIEAAIPLHARGHWNRAHLGPNLALTVITFATNVGFSIALLGALAGLEARGIGLLPRLALPTWATTIVAVLALDFSFYVAHVSMHKVPAFWRVHRVHHSDPAVDVTTTIRQHPGEGVLRYVFLGAFALPLGVGAGPFALYRLWSVLSGLLEHANLRVPAPLDDALSFVFTWPNTHKIHHSRHARLTDTNYGNLFSWWDRLLGTFTPARRGALVAYGLAGYDDPAMQSTAALLRLPFRTVGDPPAGERAALNPASR